MTKRRTITAKQALIIAVQQGGIIPCYRCRLAFDAETIKTAEREHVHELELGGSDELENMRFSHKDCHAVITNGSGATTAGSSKQRIAKVKRLRGETRTGPKAKIASRGFQKHPTLKKKMDGTIVPRSEKHK
jgi:hypothetical protein